MPTQNLPNCRRKGRVWKRTRSSHKQKHNPTEKLIKQPDLELLEIAQAEGLICLKYLDESGFCLWSPVNYSYIKKGEQKHLEQFLADGIHYSVFI